MSVFLKLLKTFFKRITSHGGNVKRLTKFVSADGLCVYESAYFSIKARPPNIIRRVVLPQIRTINFKESGNSFPIVSSRDYEFYESGLDNKLKAFVYTYREIVK